MAEPGALVDVSNLPAPGVSGQPAAPTPAAQDQDADRHSVSASGLDDPDEAVLVAARAEAAAAEGQQPTPQPTPAQQPAPTTTQQPAPQQGQPRQQQIMIPKGRLDEALRSNQALKDENVYLRGVADARRVMGQQQPQAGADPAQAAGNAPLLTPQQSLAQYQARITAAAKQFDQGEITMEQFVTVQAEVNGAIAEERGRALLAAMPRAAPTVGIADQDIMTQHLQQMAVLHPWSTVLSDQELTFLADLARQEATGLGKPIGTGPVETIRLRTAVAELSDVYGPRWYPHRAAPGAVQQQAPAQPQQQPRQPAPAPRPASPQAQLGAQRLALAGQQPPNINHAGAAGNSADLITEEQVAGMTTDEIEALPPQLRARILNSG